MKTATNSAPKRCACGGLFDKPRVHRPTSWRDLNAPFSCTTDQTQLAQERSSWFCQCKLCKIYAVWSFPAIWRERSPLALFNTYRVIG